MELIKRQNKSFKNVFFPSFRQLYWGGGIFQENFVKKKVYCLKIAFLFIHLRYYLIFENIYQPT
jgi:hypothetical protein